MNDIHAHRTKTIRFTSSRNSDMRIIYYVPMTADLSEDRDSDVQTYIEQTDTLYIRLDAEFINAFEFIVPTRRKHRISFRRPHIMSYADIIGREDGIDEPLMDQRLVTIPQAAFDRKHYLRRHRDLRIRDKEMELMSREDSNALGSCATADKDEMFDIESTSIEYNAKKSIYTIHSFLSEYSDSEDSLLQYDYTVAESELFAEFEDQFNRFIREGMAPSSEYMDLLSASKDESYPDLEYG